MTTLEAFVVIARHSMDVAIWLWPVSTALGVAAVIAFGSSVRLRNALRGRTFGIVLACYVMPLVVIAIGAVFRYDGPPSPQWIEPPQWRGLLLCAALGANILAIVAVGLFTQGARKRTALVALPSVWLSASSGFVAAMAIVGRGL